MEKEHSGFILYCSWAQLQITPTFGRAGRRVLQLPACGEFSSEQAKEWEKNTQVSFSTAPGRNYK
jgi:hypothetical protein